MKKYRIHRFDLLAFAILGAPLMDYFAKNYVHRDDMIIILTMIRIAYLCLMMCAVVQLSINMLCSEKGLTKAFLMIPIWTVRWDEIIDVSIVRSERRDTSLNIVFCTDPKEILRPLPKSNRAIELIPGLKFVPIDDPGKKPQKMTNKNRKRFSALPDKGLTKKQFQQLLDYVHQYYGPVDYSWFPEYRQDNVG